MEGGGSNLGTTYGFIPPAVGSVKRVGIWSVSPDGSKWLFYSWDVTREPAVPTLQQKDLARASFIVRDWNEGGDMSGVYDMQAPHGKFVNSDGGRKVHFRTPDNGIGCSLHASGGGRADRAARYGRASGTRTPGQMSVISGICRCTLTDTTSHSCLPGLVSTTGAKATASNGIVRAVPCPTGRSVRARRQPSSGRLNVTGSLLLSDH